MQGRNNDSVNGYVNELTSRIVTESGIPSDRFHLGKIILQSLKESPDHVLQIDGVTGESETNGSVLERSVRCAIAFRKIGLKQGDVMILMAPNHLHLTIPYYAALYLGIAIAPIDRDLTVQELKDTFSADSPKIVFCQRERAKDVNDALSDLCLDTQIVTFDDINGLKSITSKICSFEELLSKGDGVVDDFRVSDFDPEQTLAMLIATSGTTGLPKQAAATHKNFVVTGPIMWFKNNQVATPTRLALIVSPLQWLSAIAHFNMAPVLKYTRLQSSSDVTNELAYDLINKYRPTFLIISPTFLTSLTKPGDRDNCDFSCFEVINTGGSAVSTEVIATVKKLTPKTKLFIMYGMSEITGPAFVLDDQPVGTHGKPSSIFKYRLVDVETQEDITKAQVPGELWIKGPGNVKGYYNNIESTMEAFTEEGWFKTGDVLYRDENWNFFFVERLKLLLKYKNHQVSPVEVENVIRKHPGVLDVAVSGIPDQELGDLIVACVVRNDGSDVTAQEIKDLVKDTLTDTKQLRGGVIFLKDIPLTATGKLHRRKIKEIVCDMEKE